MALHRDGVEVTVKVKVIFGPRYQLNDIIVKYYMEYAAVRRLSILDSIKP